MRTHAAVAGKLVLSFVIIMIGIFLISMVYIVIALVKGIGVEDMNFGGNLTHYLQMLLFITSAIGMHAMFERNKGWSLGIKQRNGAAMLIHGMLAGIILISISALLIWAFGAADLQTNPRSQQLFLSMLSGLLLFIGVAVSEEIFSRGYVQGLLRHHYGRLPAIIVSSILFALLHSLNPEVFSSPLPIINLFLAGFIMAAARELTGGLWWPIGLHLTWNYFQGYVFGFQVSGTAPEDSILSATDHGPSWLSGGGFGIEGSLISALLLIIGIIGVYYLYSKKTPLVSEER